MNLQDVMTTDIMTCDASDTLSECAMMMKDMNVGSMPVVDEYNHLVGIITDRDITIRAVAEGIDPNDTKVRDFMSMDMVIADPSMSVEDAANLMADHQIRRLPIVSSGELVGIVSLGDLAVDVGEEEMVGQTLEEISKPVK